MKTSPRLPLSLASGPGSRRDVALTFDDGPKPVQTVPILATLEHLHATATSFEEGRHAAGNEALMREILAAGDEIGNHTFDHVTVTELLGGRFAAGS